MMLQNNEFTNTIIKQTSPLPGSTPYIIVYTLSVKLKFDNYTLLNMYSELFPHVDKKIWQKKIEKGLITINNKKAKPTSIVKAGWLTQNKIENKIEPWVCNNITKIFEDENILVVNKPSPLPMHPSGRFNKNTLINLLKLAFNQINLKIIHRLDANTTGVIILAKNSEIANLISKQFQSNCVKKEYYALVEGIVEKDTQIINKKIGTSKTLGGGRKTNNNGQVSETEIQVIKRHQKQNCTLLLVKPKQGRTNQIRIHLASINHPIVGDLSYNNSDYIKNNPLTYPSDSLFLHAFKIKIKHKNTDTQFIAELPKKFIDFM